ncbi:hypothetical protein [Flavitalea sp.]|nr:hypothetical protein [Flavitalea sp.]
MPVLHNSFASDDFKAVYRAGVKGHIFGPGFFRPFSDLTIFITYAAVGSDTFYYHFSNVVLHGCSAFFLYLLALRLPFLNGMDNRQSFAWYSSILFVTYPFHNESITWIVGRGSESATFFALACMLIFVSKIKPLYKYLYTGCLYFIGLLAYESILFLPVILFLISCKKQRSKNEMAKWLLVFLLVLISYFAIRYIMAGVVIGEYGHGIFSIQVLRYAANIFKVMGRMFLPPSHNSLLLTVAFSTLVVLYLGSWFMPAKAIPDRINARKDELIILFCMLVSLIIPITFGISTQTSEGERLLYFPSVFISLFFACLIVESSARKIFKRLLMVALVIFNIIFVEINNSYWIKASYITDAAIKQTIDIAGSDREIVFVNVPGEYHGAYIFRNSFKEAMLLNNIDTQKVQVANYLNHAEYNSLPGKILPEIIADTLHFGKSVKMSAKRLSITNYDKPDESVKYIEIKENTEIWFWDKHQFLRYQ